MPEITDAEYRMFVLYQGFGTPTEVTKKIGDLETDNKKQRDEIRDLRAQVPAEGSVLLSKEDGAKHTAYKALGEPAALKTRLAEGDAAKQRVEEHETRSAVQEFAKAAGISEDAIDTLIAIPALKGAKFEVRKKKNDKGEEVPSPYITLTGDGEKAMSLEDAVVKVPALKGLKPAEKGKPPVGFVKQGSEAGTPSGDAQQQVLDKIRTKAKDEKESVGKLPAGTKSVEERMGMVRTG